MMHRSAEIAVAEVARKIQNYAGPRLVLLDIREPFELALCDLRLHLLKNLNPECASAQGGSVMLTSTTTAKEPISSHATSKWRPRVRNQHISIEYDDDEHPPAPCLLPHVSFLHVPMGQIKIKMDQLTPFKNEEVVVYCHLGQRSEMVVRYLRDQEGFVQARNMTGGLDMWSSVVDPSLPRY